MSDQQRIKVDDGGLNRMEKGSGPRKKELNKMELLERAQWAPESLTPKDIMDLQRLIGNHAVHQLFSEYPLQRKRVEEAAVGYIAGSEGEPLQKKRENKTGLPDQLKEGVESLSGIDMSDVRVYYNSDEPAKVGALAYTRATDIHVAQGMERYLSHEAWHVVQQKQGRVRPTMQLKGIAVNDDEGLEQEAEEMGKKAFDFNNTAKQSPIYKPASPPTAAVQMARLIEKPGPGGMGKEQYVLVDVPPDGSCQLSSFNLGFTAARMLHEIQINYNPGLLTPDDVEDLLIEAFRNEQQQAGRGDGSNTGDEGASSGEDMEVVPSLQNAFNEANLLLRHRICDLWADLMGEYSNRLKRDIKSIIMIILQNTGLIKIESGGKGRETDKIQDVQMSESTTAINSSTSGDEGQKQQVLSGKDESTPALNFSGPGDEKQKSQVLPGKDDEIKPFQLSDEEFIYNALYHPERLSSIRTIQGEAQSKKQTKLTDFVPKAGKPSTIHVPMGITEEGILAEAIRGFVNGWVQQFGESPLHNVPVPNEDQIPDELIELYITEFQVNERMWGGESALTAAGELTNSRVDVHTFDENSRHVTTIGFNSTGTNGPVNIYQDGGQVHFQVLIGPFFEGFIKSDEPMEETEDDEDFVEEDEENEENEENEEDDDAFMTNPDEDSLPMLETPGGLILKGMESKDEQYNKDLWFLQMLSHRLSEPIDESVYPRLLQRLFRAAAVTGRKFSTVDEACGIIREYDEEMRRKEAERMKGQPFTQPIVPMAGFVGELLETYRIPLNEILRLLPHAQSYSAFHKKRKSWKKKQAVPRIDALKGIAGILNEWSRTREEPALYRGPSVAEFNTQPSSLAKGEQVGASMRALLTIDPGSLTGYEPESYESWEEFNDVMPGYVRAHLLNKHLGGPGIPENLAFLSSADNTKMSELGEEEIKRMVLEENRQIFYKVLMPAGMDEIHKIHKIPKEYTDMMVREVNMYAAEIKPGSTGGDPVFEEGEDFLAEKFVLGTGGRVGRNTEGGIRMAAAPPSPETVSKIMNHWTKRKKEAKTRSLQTGLDAHFTEHSDLPAIEKAAHKEILKAKDEAEWDQILKTVSERLKQIEVDEKEIVSCVARLVSKWRSKTMPEKAEAKARKKEEDRKKKPQKKRVSELKALLRKKGISLTQSQMTEVWGLTDASFNKYILLMDSGMNHSEAIVECKRNKKKVVKIAEGVKKQARGTGIHKYLQPQPPPK
ncbi:MAG: DUF4157 domain-containing protein [Clostridia bacterium]|nr:DUF4157 domain-containing protein [Clostridia bacterium]